MLRVTPYPHFVERVAARRGDNDFAAPIAPLNEKKVWRAFDERVVHAKRNWWMGRLKTDAHVQSAVKMVQGAKLPDPFDELTVAVTERVTTRDDDPSFSLVQLVADTRGVAAMVAMKLRSVSISIRYNSAELGIDIEDLTQAEAPVYDSSWKLARAIVCRADDASYEAASEVAAEWRKSHPVVHRIAADYLFPERTSWANDDLAEILPHLATSPLGYSHCAQPLLATTDDVAGVTTFLSKLNQWDVGSLARTFACDLAVGLPTADALRVLCNILASAKGAGKNDLAELAIAMCALEGEDMAKELAGLLLHSPIGPRAVDYFRRFPHLAKVALPKIATGASKAADAARSICTRKLRKRSCRSRARTRSRWPCATSRGERRRRRSPFRSRRRRRCRRRKSSGPRASARRRASSTTRTMDGRARSKT